MAFLLLFLLSHPLRVLHRLTASERRLQCLEVWHPRQSEVIVDHACELREKLRPDEEFEGRSHYHAKEQVGDARRVACKEGAYVDNAVEETELANHGLESTMEGKAIGRGHLCVHIDAGESR